jgi:ketosteroid isomerase-like protein
VAQLIGAKDGAGPRGGGAGVVPTAMMLLLRATRGGYGLYQRQLQALQDTFVLGMLVGDADLCASVYAPEACMRPPDRQLLVGRGEIRDFWQKVIDDGGRGDAVISEDVAIRDGRIVERGVYARFAHPVRLGPPIARGNYLLVIERQPAGGLAWAADVWTQAPQAGSSR